MQTYHSSFKHCSNFLKINILHNTDLNKALCDTVKLQISASRSQYRQGNLLLNSEHCEIIVNPYSNEEIIISLPYYCNILFVALLFHKLGRKQRNKVCLEEIFKIRASR